MSTKRFHTVDAHTGEYIEGTMAFIAPKRKNGFKDWVAMEQVNALRAFAKAKLSNEDRRVWSIMMSYVGYENEITETPSFMADELGISRSNFARSLNHLCEEGIFIRERRNGRTIKMWLNPEYGWKGTAKNHVVALADVRKQRLVAEAV